MKQATGSNYFSDPMAELRNLKQVGTVSDYITQFKSLFEKAEINELYAVHLFVSGLNHSIQQSVRMFMPRSLVHAFASARLQESCVNFRGNYYANPEVNEEILIEETEMDMVMISKERDLPTGCGYEKVDVLEESWIGKINKEIGVNLMEEESSLEGSLEDEVWMEETENEMVMISKEGELTAGCGYANEEVFEEEVWMEEAEQETVVMKLQGSSSQSEAQPARNLGELHTAARSQSPSEEIWKRNFEK